MRIAYHAVLAAAVLCCVGLAVRADEDLIPDAAWNGRPIEEVSWKYAHLADALDSTWIGLWLLRNAAELAPSAPTSEARAQSAQSAVSILEGYGAERAADAEIPSTLAITGAPPDLGRYTVLSFALGKGFLGPGRTSHTSRVATGGLITVAADLVAHLDAFAGLAKRHEVAAVVSLGATYGSAAGTIFQAKVDRLSLLVNDVATLVDLVREATLRACAAQDDALRSRVWLDVRALATAGAGRPDEELPTLGLALPRSLVNDALVAAQEVRDDLVDALASEL